MPSSWSTCLCRLSFICTTAWDGLEACVQSIRPRPEGGEGGAHTRGVKGYKNNPEAKDGAQLTYGGHGVVRCPHQPLQQLPGGPGGASRLPHQLAESGGRLEEAGS